MKKKKYIFSHLFFIWLCLLCLIPFLMLISASLTNQTELIRDGVKLIPNQIDLEAYRVVLRDSKQIIDAYKTSIIVTVVGTILSLLISAMVAYPLSRNSYKYGRITSFYLYFTLLFSGGLVPFYLLCTKYLDLRNSIWALILPLLSSPTTIFLLRTYFKSVPESLYEAAELDGASEYQIFFKIQMPLSKPALATVGFIIALGYWNDWYHAMLFVDVPELTPLQQLLQQLNDYIAFLKNSQMTGNVTLINEIPSDGVVAATCLVAIGPMLLVFMFFQKYFISGITSGAVKG